MDSSKEKIEAQLCAYIEGELDDADRADIERHLQTNPQHKSLMAELRRHRELLQTLPRATVPGELNENLTGQLERSALLNDDDETAEAGVRINRWPQLTAVAAVLLLAVGLGIVVYYVLPPAGGHHANVAMEAGVPQRKAATVPGDADRGTQYGIAPATEPAGKLAEAEALNDAVSRERKSSNAPVAAATPAPVPSQMPAEAKAVPPTTPLASATDPTAQRLRDLTSGPGLVTSGEVEELQKRMSRTLGGEANAAFNLEPRSSLYLIVQTPDAVATSGQVAAYFKTNNIQYMNYEGPPIDLGSPADGPAKLSVADADGDVTKGGALGGGLSSSTPTGGRKVVVRAETADRARGYGGYSGSGSGSGGGGAFGGGGGAPGARPQASAEARRGAEPAPTDTLAQKQENANRAAGSAAVAQTQPDYERLVRRGLVRGEDLGAAAPTSQPSVALDAAKKPTGAAATQAVSEHMAEAGVKAKSDGSALALGDKPAAIAKDELSLGMRQGLAPAAGVRAPSGPQPTNSETGQNGQAAQQPTASAGYLPGDTTWNVRLGGVNANAARGGVIVARMNRRQASELEGALSREQGQRAELRDFGSITAAGTPVVGKAAAAGAEDVAAGRARATTDNEIAADKAVVAEKAAADALRLTPHPADEPVDVVIVVKPGSAAPPAASAKPETDTKK